MTENPLVATTKRTPNKGFRIWVGDTYIGYLNIGEKNVDPMTVSGLQDPAVMTAILAQAELRPYEDEKPRDMSTVNDIIMGAKIAAAQPRG